MDNLNEIFDILSEIEENKKSEGISEKVFTLEFIKYGEYCGLINLIDICQDLNRDLNEVETYLRKHIALPYLKSEYKSKKMLCFKNLTKVKKATINELLNAYVKEFVKCKRCKNLYTELIENNITCKACGSKYSV